VDCVQLAAAVSPASLLAGVNVVSFFTGGPIHAAASCEHHSGSKLPTVHGARSYGKLPKVQRCTKFV
jgi:hypothetical protein